jgi:hypothetical protein
MLKGFLLNTIMLSNFEMITEIIDYELNGKKRGILLTRF